MVAGGGAEGHGALGDVFDDPSVSGFALVIFVPVGFTGGSLGLAVGLDTPEECVVGEVDLVESHITKYTLWITR